MYELKLSHYIFHILIPFKSVFPASLLSFNTHWPFDYCFNSAADLSVTIPTYPPYFKHTHTQIILSLSVFSFFSLSLHTTSSMSSALSWHFSLFSYTLYPLPFPTRSFPLKQHHESFFPPHAIMRNGLDVSVCEFWSERARRGEEPLQSLGPIYLNHHHYHPIFPRHFNPGVLPLGFSVCFHIPSKAHGSPRS